ncbi:MAG: Rrf2 family transcriptional regulator [Phycisphaerales bacterium]|nr:Rrf2 family transcriptional regulator [Phycisphaerales bacterium]
MISQAAEYSLRAMLLLAGGESLPMTTTQIATHTRVPSGYLAKILQGLVKAGLITSQRGVNGGFTLNKPAHQLTLMDVVRVTDSSHRIHVCPLGNPDHYSLCPLHRRLDAAAAAAERELGDVTLADLVAEQKRPFLCKTHETVIPAQPLTINQQAASADQPAQPKDKK